MLNCEVELGLGDAEDDAAGPTATGEGAPPGVAPPIGPGFTGDGFTPIGPGFTGDGFTPIGPGFTGDGLT